MEREQIKIIVIKIIYDVLGGDRNTFRECDLLYEDHGADSIDIVQIIIALESELIINFDEGEIYKSKTIKDVIDYVEKEFILRKLFTLQKEQYEDNYFDAFGDYSLSKHKNPNDKVCMYCGSDKVEKLAWVEVNTLKFVNDFEGKLTKYCNNCTEYTDLIKRKAYD